MTNMFPYCELIKLHAQTLQRWKNFFGNGDVALTVYCQRRNWKWSLSWVLSIKICHFHRLEAKTINYIFQSVKRSQLRCIKKGLEDTGLLKKEELVSHPYFFKDMQLSHERDAIGKAISDTAPWISEAIMMMMI